MTTATAAVGSGISLDGVGVNDAGIVVVVVCAAVVVAVTGDDGIGSVERAGSGIIVVAAAVSLRLQHEPSLHHHMAKPRMESICHHKRERECWMDQKASNQVRGTQELGTAGRGTCQDTMRNHHIPYSTSPVPTQPTKIANHLHFAACHEGAFPYLGGSFFFITQLSTGLTIYPPIQDPWSGSPLCQTFILRQIERS